MLRASAPLAPLLLVVGMAAAQDAPPAPDPADPAAPWVGRWFGERAELRLEPIGETRAEGRIVQVLGGPLARGEDRWAVEMELHPDGLRGTAVGEGASVPLSARLDEGEMVLLIGGVEQRFGRGGQPRELVVRVGQRWTFGLEGGRRRVLEVTAVEGERVTYLARELAAGDAPGSAGEPAPGTWTPEAQAGEPARVELLRIAGHRVTCQVRTERGTTRWLATRAGAASFPGEVRREVDGRRVLELLELAEPPGPDLSHLRVGQRFIYRLGSNGVEMTQEWVVTGLGPTAIQYTLQIFLLVPGQGPRTAIGDPSALEWTLPPPGAAPPGPGPTIRGLTTREEQVTVGDVTFDCVVYEMESEGQVSRSWIPVSRGFATFPPILRSELNGETVMELVEVR